ncbi:MAG: putative DNA binding domain-containing protein [Lachnospiraceae bacterium]|nr:putative DNA binding domain-containing protein [Lachnospiraceae bacterium]
MSARTEEYLRSIVRELVKLPVENEWVEFKCNNKDTERIAKYISGLSNAAALCERPNAYLVWGVADDTHQIVGTDFEYRKARKGNEELEAWLARMINPKINFHFYDIFMENGKKITLLEIPCAEKETVKYGSSAMIRIGSSLKPLVDYPEKERELWKRFDTTAFELRIAERNISEDEVIHLLDFSRYYDVLQVPIPRNRESIMEDFCHEKFIKRNEAGNYDITNLGALVISKNIKEFEPLGKRAVRVIRYKSSDRLDGISEREFCSGYAFSHEEIVQYIMAVIPQEEVIEGSVRRSVYAFPEIAIRELLANIMIHQSLEQRGTSPMVEIFSNRIEFSNPGAPLVDINRMVDTVPVSRNENIAGFLHKCGICEERGSGYDKVIRSTGKNKLLAPMVINQSNQFTKTVMFAKIPFSMITKEDRIRTCYMQACLAYVEFSAISNSDIRELFDLDEKDKVKASRIIKDTIAAGLIKPLDPDTAPRYMKYIPAWA